MKEVQQEVQHHDTVGKADEMLVEEAKRHEKLRRSKPSSGWDLGHGPEQLRVTTGVIAEQYVMEDTTWMGSNYMTMTGISHVEMLEEAGSLGFVACTVLAAEGVPVYSKGLSDLLQNMGFIASD